MKKKKKPVEKDQSTSNKQIGNRPTSTPGLGLPREKGGGRYEGEDNDQVLSKEIEPCRTEGQIPMREKKKNFRTGCRCPRTKSPSLWGLRGRTTASGEKRGDIF